MMQELQRQLDSKGLVVKKGSIQGATFITNHPAALLRGAQLQFDYLKNA
jgi:hypothetical protein